MPKPKHQHRTHQHLITTKLTPTTCRKCKQPTWEGHCNGEPVRIDPTPITRDTETGTILAGQTTYAVDTYTQCPTQRTHWNIGHWPTTATIHAQHQCRRTWPTNCIDHTNTPQKPTQRPTGGLLDQPPPF